MAIREALSWIISRGFISILLESDALGIVKRLSSSEDLSYVGSYNNVVKPIVQA